MTSAVGMVQGRGEGEWRGRESSSSAGAARTGASREGEPDEAAPLGGEVNLMKLLLLVVRLVVGPRLRLGHLGKVKPERQCPH